MSEFKIKKYMEPLSKLKKNLEIKFYQQLDEGQYPNQVKRLYKKITGEKLDWDNLSTFTEKMQWAKIHDNNPMKTKLSDKYLVRDWVKETIGAEYLIPSLGVWDSFDEIDFSKLPSEFVLKTNHASNTNLIVKDKKKLDYKKAEKFFEKSMKKNQAFYYGFQMHYQDIERKIIAEEFIEDSKGLLPEFKFFCFDGKVHYCWYLMETESQRYGNVYDEDWNLQPWRFTGRENTIFKVKKPNNFDEMVDIATKLSKDFSHVRVDLYNVDEKIYFGEMTFTSASGYRLPTPEKYNHMLGDLWDLQEK